jgi:predicted DNA-binding transcriptional regulator YafY
MGKVSNALLMLKLLESGRKYTVKELSEKLEVTPRMIKIYKEDLEKSGIYIDTIRGQYGGYVYNKKHDYNVSFDYFDVDSIESVLDKLDIEEQEKINITLEKIKSIVIYSSDEKRNIKIDKEDLEKKYQMISKAIKNSEVLLFKFHNKLREFIPYSFTFYKEFIYITGYSILENDIKTLNLSKIKDLKKKQK